MVSYNFHGFAIHRKQASERQVLRGCPCEGDRVKGRRREGQSVVFAQSYFAFGMQRAVPCGAHQDDCNRYIYKLYPTGMLGICDF